jgi:hypothetical protein
MKRTLLQISSILILLMTFTACDGDKDFYYDATDALTGYPEMELVTFSIAGNAVCSNCQSRDMNILALLVDVTPKSDPTQNLALMTFEGLGPFAFADLKAEPGSTVILYGRLYYGSGDSALNASVEIQVPEEEGQTVSCILKFPAWDD